MEPLYISFFMKSTMEKQRKYLKSNTCNNVTMIKNAKWNEKKKITRIFKWLFKLYVKYVLQLKKKQQQLKSLGPIDRKFHGHGEKDGIVLYEYIIKQFSGFCKHTNISDLKKNCQIK